MKILLNIVNASLKFFLKFIILKWISYILGQGSWTYIESDGPSMRGEFLLERPTSAELITWCYHPEASGCIAIICNPAMNFVVFVLP